jgi:hypothetical protein
VEFELVDEHPLNLPRHHRMRAFARSNLARLTAQIARRGRIEIQHSSTSHMFDALPR